MLNENNQTREGAVIHRVLLFTPSIRKNVDLYDISHFVNKYISDNSPFKAKLLEIINKHLVCVKVRFIMFRKL